VRINIYRELDNKFETQHNVNVIKAGRLEELWNVVKSDTARTAR
jgi:hypothetical protein